MKLWRDVGEAMQAGMRRQRLRDDRWTNYYILDLYALHDAAEADARIIRLVREAMT